MFERALSHISLYILCEQFFSAVHFFAKIPIKKKMKKVNSSCTMNYQIELNRLEL